MTAINAIEPRIHNFVFTGGPCGGKTTALAHVREELEQLGYIVMTVPEAATLAIVAGVNPALPYMLPMLQETILGVSLALEDRMHAAAVHACSQAAAHGKKGVVILHDRGIPDGNAYVDGTTYRGLLRQFGLNIVSARDARYDAVFHLVTAADGAEEYYTLANNEARSEDASAARLLDARTQNAYVGHPHLRVIDNRTDFAGKLKRLMQEVLGALGEPVPIERERKFLVSIDRERMPTTGTQRVEIEQHYLFSPDPNTVRRVRQRGQEGYSTYYLTEKRDHGPGQRLEIERQIGEREYRFALSMADPAKHPVRKVRTCFVHAGQYFELDEFEALVLPNGVDALLELELTLEQRDIILPPWLSSKGEVTDDPAFGNVAIAARLAAGSAA